MNLKQGNTPQQVEWVLFVFCVIILSYALLQQCVQATITMDNVPHQQELYVFEELPQRKLAIEDFPRVTVTATGYFAGRKSTGKDPGHPAYGITYSGVKVRRDLFSTIAADIRLFPLGTILYIPDYGYGIVADTGSKIIGKKIDLYFETEEDVYKQWGMRKVDVYVLKKGDGYVSEEMLARLNQDQAAIEQIIVK